MKQPQVGTKEMIAKAILKQNKKPHITVDNISSIYEIKYDETVETL